MAEENESTGIADAKGRKRWGRKMEMETPLRALAFGATLSAAIVMATNKQTKNITVVTPNVTVTLPLTAKYHDTHAFVFFVVMNSIASGYALLTLLTSFMVKHVYKSPRSDHLKFPLSILDSVIVVALMAAASAAAAISEVGKNGNPHTRWNKVCDNFGRFCNHGSGALIASLAGVAIFMLLNLVSTYSLHKRARRLTSNASTSTLTV